MFHCELDFLEHGEGSKSAFPLIRFVDTVIGRHTPASHMKVACGDQAIPAKYIELDPITGHQAAEGAEKAVDTFRTIVPEALGMPLEQHFVHGFDADRTPQDHQVIVAAQAFALTFTEFKIAQVNTQQDHPTWLAPPFPVIAPENLIRPVRPAIFTKAIKHHRMQRLHRDVLLDVVRVERDVLKDGQRWTIHRKNLVNGLKLAGRYT